MTDWFDHVTPMPRVVENDRNPNATFPPKTDRRPYIWAHNALEHASVDDTGPIRLPVHWEGVVP